MRILRTFAILSVCLCAAARANAQQIGILGGLNVTNIAFSPSLSSVFEDEFGFDNASVTRHLGLLGGVQFAAPLGGDLRLVVEGLVRQGGITIDADIADFTGQAVLSDKIKLTWVEVPVMLDVAVGRNAHVQGGIFVASKVHQKEHVKFAFEDEIIQDDDVTGSDQTQLKSLNVGVAIGVQVRASRLIDIGGRLNLGLTNIDNEVETGFESIKAGGFSVFVVFHPGR